MLWLLLKRLKQALLYRMNSAGTFASWPFICQKSLPVMLPPLYSPCMKLSSPRRRAFFVQMSSNHFQSAFLTVFHGCRGSWLFAVALGGTLPPLLSTPSLAPLPTACLGLQLASSVHPCMHVVRTPVCLCLGALGLP